MKPRLWIDLETTGLDPDPFKSRILEWAVCCVSPALDVELSYSSPIHVPTGELAELQAADLFGPGVYQMHTDSGLWTEVAKSTHTLTEVEDFLVGLVDRMLGAKDGQRAPGKIELAGNNVHFDLEFVRGHMPQLAKRLSYRIFDVRTLMSAAEETAPTIPRWVAAESHRALPDIRASLENAKIALDYLRGYLR
jgi:oligoribonuclease (3'-5' exoribonuclease)